MTVGQTQSQVGESGLCRTGSELLIQNKFSVYHKWFSMNSPSRRLVSGSRARNKEETPCILWNNAKYLTGHTATLIDYIVTSHESELLILQLYMIVEY